MVATETVERVRYRQRVLHERQREIIESHAKRLVIRAGRRGGKTVVAAAKAIAAFVRGQRVLYGAPTQEQVETFWYEVKWALEEVIQKGYVVKNETEHYIEVPGTKQRIRAKTAWNADTLRGDFADLLILDEWQLMDEDAWELVGAPMLLDHDGDAMFIYTPPSLRSAGVSKAKDPRHAAKMFLKAKGDKTGRWGVFHFTSHDNPYISGVALAEITQDMTRAAYQAEIMAEDDEMSATKLVYGTWKESLCKIPRFDIPANWPRFNGHDFGKANPAALFFAQVQLPLPKGAPAYMRLHDLVAYREYLPGPGYSTAQHVDRFKEIMGGAPVVKAMGGNQTTEDEIRQGYGSHGYPIGAPSVVKPNAQIDRVIGLMELNKLYVFSDLVNYLDELFNCLWKLDKDGRITNEIDNEAKYHLLAAQRYILSDFRPDTVDTGEDIAKVTDMRPSAQVTGRAVTGIQDWRRRA